MRKMKLVELFTDSSINRQELDTANDNYNKQIETLNSGIIRLNKDMKKQGYLLEKIVVIDNTVDTFAGLEEFSDEVCESCMSCGCGGSRYISTCKGWKYKRESIKNIRRLI